MPPKRTVSAESSRPTKRKQTSKVQVSSSSTQRLATNPASIPRSIEDSIAQQGFGQQLLTEVSNGPRTSGSTGPAERDGVELKGFNVSVGTVVRLNQSVTLINSNILSKYLQLTIAFLSF